MALPLIEIFSVVIFPDSLPCEVYGDIFVYDADNSKQTYKLYQRHSEHPEVIYKDKHALILTGPDVALSMPKPVISVRLMDRARDKALIVCGTDRLHIATDDYEEVRYSEIKGDHGHVRVNYVAMPCGAVAQVWISPNVYENDVIKKLLEELARSQEGFDQGFPVYGTVVAHYGKTYRCDASRQELSSTLLNISPNESIPVVFNTHEQAFLQLTKNLVAVPAYSSLVIEADLKERNTNKPFLHGTAKLWVSLGDTFSKMRAADKTPRYISSENAFLSASWLHISELQPSSIIDKSACMSLKSKNNLVRRSDIKSLLELYSVFIGREDDADLSVSGMISVRHDNGILDIFDRDDNNADRLLKGRKLLSVSGPSIPAEFMRSDDNYYIAVDLKDVNDRFLIECGSVKFDTCMIQKDELKFDKLLCSVIQGEGGYCAFHYTIFESAVRLRVKCVVLCESVDIAKVYGRIVAWYDMFNYTVEYQRKYYQRVLFENSEDDEDHLRKVASKKTEESFSDKHKLTEVEFSRSYVAMPVDGYTLFIQVDLRATSHPERATVEHFHRTLQFELGGDSPQKIQGEDFDILVYVEMLPQSAV